MPEVPSTTFKRRRILRAASATFGTLASLALLAFTTAAPDAHAQAQPVPGEVIKLDKSGGRVTLKHGGIKHLDMPPMTLAFRAAEPRLLEGLNPGDRVRFTAERINGQYTLLSISKLP